MTNRLGLYLAIAGVAIFTLFGVTYALHPRGMAVQSLAPTLAEVQAVHAPVKANGAEISRVRRLAVGASIETEADGRARVRLDDGTQVIVAGDTKIVLSERGLSVERGRVFVIGAAAAHTELQVGAAMAFVTGANVAVTRPKAGTSRIYAASGDTTVRIKADVTVHVGETATVDGESMTVAPERAFDDWTSGLAAPWSASGAPRRAVGELWGRPTGTRGDLGSPLTLRSHEVAATVDGEMAETQVRMRFFHAGSSPVDGDFRMALPAGAIVARFAAGTSDAPPEATVGLAARDGATAGLPSAMLEWAGEGWVRGRVAAITPGTLVTVLVTYVEWLSPSRRADGMTQIVEYRFPMVADGPPPIIGEFSARIDARAAAPKAIAAGLGASVAQGVVELRRSDFRPSADLVVEIESAAPTTGARLFTAPAADDDDGGDYALVRAESPAPRTTDGVALALVVDTSGSIEPSMLDAARALVESIVGALGVRDRVVVLTTDDATRAVGPAKMGLVDDARRAAITSALARLTPGGATDLGRALEAAADALDPAAAAPMVVYIGDGWPSMGDSGADPIRARLARRAGGAPRLGAVAVGPVANRFALSALVRGGGAVLEIQDREGAAATAMTLLAQALRPVLADVELRLGANVEQVYPRGAQSVAAGETIVAVGRVRGETPKAATLVYRDGAGVHEQKLAIAARPVRLPADVRRRWAAARVEEIALRGRGREAATDVALRTGLLTPWTAWVVGGGVHGIFKPTPLATRTFDLASGAEAIFTASLETRPMARVLDGPATELGDEPDANDDPEGYREAVRAATERILDEAAGAFRACRDSRAALRPDLSGSISVTFDVDGAGRAAKVVARGADGADDASLDQCIQVVVAGLTFPASALTTVVRITRDVVILAGRAPREGKCSAIAALPLALRRGLWNERLDHEAPLDMYLKAKRGCELATWTDRRALLELVLGHVTSGVPRLRLAGELDAAGDPEAGAFLRREALRRASTADELRSVRAEMARTEHYPAGAFRRAYLAVGDDAARLAVIERFLGLAPHDARLRRLELLVLEALGKNERVAEAARRVARDPLSDAGVLAEAAAVLRRIGDEAEARRTYGEIVERAPADPWARAFAGDRLRSEGWFDDAIRVYATLDAMVGDDPAAVLRPALAHAGAGRTDVAARMLARAAQIGGRSDATASDLAADLAHVLLGEARTRYTSANETSELRRRAIELPTRPGASFAMVRAPAWGPRLIVELARGPAASRETRPADLAAAGLGLYEVRVDAVDGRDAVLRIAMKRQLPPARPLKVTVWSVVAGEPGEPPTLGTSELEVPSTGQVVELRWIAGRWVVG